MFLDKDILSWGFFRKRRCIGAKQYLEQYYHIDCSRIEMFVHGTDNPRYSIDKWNRCLVIKCNNK